MRRNAGILVGGAAGILALSACAPFAPAAAVSPRGAEAAVESRSRELNPAAACEEHFVVHELPFATGMRIREISTYTSNGAGLAAADLNADGLTDLVFASVDNQAEILWNQGDFNFRSETLADSLGRGVSAVDVDGDGRIDLAFSHRGLAGVTYWRNTGLKPDGSAAFNPAELPGVNTLAYALAWADLNGDNTLDLVTGSYNADLKQHTSDPAILEKQAGIVVYLQQDGRFIPQRLSGEAETLSIGLLDLNADGQMDIWSANDFLTPDQIWLGADGGWQAEAEFTQTSYSTMSIDWGDLRNRGTLELFTSDMNPYDISIETMSAWLPVMDKLEQRHDPDDPQIMQNMLQVRGPGGKWANQASARGVAASGWSWAARFGDLDNDGLLDLYVVNGMIAANLFSYLPNGELVEENQAFRNRGSGGFEKAAAWGLNLTTSGRGMVMADLNNDGRLDIAINNLRASAQVLENRLCGGQALEVELAWPSSANPYAIGAVLELHTSAGVYTRDVRASGGYLSSDPARVHFGIQAGATLEKLVVRWPDGAVSTVLSPRAAEILEVTR